jgi:thiamine-monophosphate kinase
MYASNTVKDIGEVKLIELIDEIIYKKRGTHLLKDDTFFYKMRKEGDMKTIVLNSDMFVASTDAPTQMNYFQMGHKSIVMNISDLLVKGVNPKAALISLGIPENLLITEFKSLIMGIVDCCYKFDIEYLGGDLNVTKEIIINPTVFGFRLPNKIIHRYGMNIGDYVLITDKFGLTGVGFEILLNRKNKMNEFSTYAKSISSVLEPSVSGDVAILLSESRLATASIDSSDGLAKSLKDLMLANPNRGFEINFNKNLIHEEARQFSAKYNVPLEKLIFSGGEEFIHIFTIKPENYQKVSHLLKSSGNTFYNIGRVIKEEKVYVNKNGQKQEIAFNGFEHFS